MIKVISSGPRPENTRVVDADTGEMISGISSVKYEVNCNGGELILTLVDFDIDIEGEATVKSHKRD